MRIGSIGYTPPQEHVAFPEHEVPGYVGACDDCGWNTGWEGLRDLDREQAKTALLDHWTAEHAGD